MVGHTISRALRARAHGRAATGCSWRSATSSVVNTLIRLKGLEFSRTQGGPQPSASVVSALVAAMGDLQEPSADENAAGAGTGRYTFAKCKGVAHPMPQWQQ